MFIESAERAGPCHESNFILTIPLFFLSCPGHSTVASINPPTYVPGTANVFQKRNAAASNSSNDTLKLIQKPRMASISQRLVSFFPAVEFFSSIAIVACDHLGIDNQKLESSFAAGIIKMTDWDTAGCSPFVCPSRSLSKPE